VVDELASCVLVGNADCVEICTLRRLCSCSWTRAAIIQYIRLRRWRAEFDH